MFSVAMETTYPRLEAVSVRTWGPAVPPVEAAGWPGVVDQYALVPDTITSDEPGTVVVSVGRPGGLVRVSTREVCWAPVERYRPWLLWPDGLVLQNWR